MPSKSVVRLVCADCLRTPEPDREDGPKRVPVTCRYCGGTIEAHVEDSSDEFVTPLSLELTPEEAPWAVAEAPAPALGTSSQVGRFQIRERLGGGGFGEVYRAYDPRLDRDVALKVLKDPHPTARLMERFFREARAAARLDHASIVPLHDAGRDEGRCWIAYQFVEGSTLERRIFAGVSTPDYLALARLVRDLAQGLDHAHRRGVVHRDVKPANVILDDEGNPRLTDFGLARRTDHLPTITIEGAILGTPAYMSPEQAAGQSHHADARSDVYSLGIVFYELLCGNRPADMPSDQPSWRVEMPRPATPPRELVRSVPPALDRICLRAISFEPADRYPDARSLALDLDAWLVRQRQRQVKRPLARFLLPAIFVITASIGGYAGGRWNALWQGQKSSASAFVAPRAVSSLAPAGLKNKELRAELDTPATKSVITRAGSKFYHVGSCPALTRLPEAKQQVMLQQVARERGFTPCSFCLRDLAFHPKTANREPDGSL